MNAVNRAVGAFMQGHDLILLPVLPRTAIPLGLMGQDDPGLSAAGYYARIFAHFPYCALFNMTGQPAASVPAGLAADGLPLSVQIAAPVGDEATVLQVARDLERARPWAAHRTTPRAVDPCGPTSPARRDRRRRGSSRAAMPPVRLALLPRLRPVRNRRPRPTPRSQPRQATFWAGARRGARNRDC